MPKKAKELADTVNDELKNIFGSSYRTGDQVEELEYIPTDIEEINRIIFSCGGIPRGKVIEVAGRTHTGKSTFCQWLCGQVQKRGGKAAWFDAEGSFSKSYAEGSGINIKELIIPKFGLGEDMLYRVKQAIASNLFDIIIIDSQDAVIPEKIKDSQPDALTMNERLLRASMWNDFHRSIIGGFTVKASATGEYIKSNVPIPIMKNGKEVISDKIHRIEQKKTCLMIVSHLMPKPGVIFGKQFDTTGGEKAKFNFSLRIWLTNRKPIMGQKNKKEILKYSEVRLSVEKNRLGFLEEGGKCLIKMNPDGSIESLKNKESEMEEIDL